MTSKEIIIMPLSKEEREILTRFNSVWLDACAGGTEEELQKLAPDYTPERIRQIMYAATIPIGDIVKMIGSQGDFSLHYCISKRTVQGWSDKAKGDCPPHLRLVFCRDLKLV